MDKNVEAQQIANKYLETEIHNFQDKIRPCKEDTIKGIWDDLHMELEIMEDCKKNADYSSIHTLIGELLPSDYKLNVKHSSYGVLIDKMFNTKVEVTQEMIKMCEGPYSYDYKGENIDLVIALKEFFAKEPAVNKWKRNKQKKTQILINELATDILAKHPNTGLTALANEISEMDRFKSSENPIKFNTIRKDYLDDFK